MYNYRPPYANELYHYGIQGQKWGVRRFQNPDGTLTSEGRQRYGNYADSGEKKQWAKTSSFERAMAKRESKLASRVEKTTMQGREDARRKAEIGLKKVQSMADKYYASSKEAQNYINRGYKASKALIIAGGIIAGPVGVIPGAVYGGYKGYQIDKMLKD